MPHPTGMRATTADSISLGCLEVWGGNRAAVSAIAAPGIDAWLCSRPFKGHDAGGDIHYVSNCAAGIITRFALADVAGHGDTASNIALQLRDLMRRNINTPDQTRIARALNRSFGALAHDGRFATAVLATYHAPSDHLILCNAGHPRPLWFRAALGVWQPLDDHPRARASAPANLPLGIIDPTSYSQFAVPLDAGDLVILYTDSLIEAANPSGEQLGERGLLEIAAAAPRDSAEHLGRAILDAVDDHRAGKESADDTTLLVLRHTAEDPPGRSLAQRMKVTARMLGLTTNAPRITPNAFSPTR